MYSDASKFSQEPTCPSGNCAWPAFRSLGWCSKCTDAYASATLQNCDAPGFWANPDGFPDLTCTLSLGHGLSTNAARVQLAPPETHLNGSKVLGVNITRDVVWALNEHSVYAEEDETFANIHAPVIALGHVSLTDGAPKDGLHVMHAEECSLSLCVREYNATTSLGVSAFKVTDVEWGGPSQSGDDCWSAGPGPIHYSHTFGGET